MLTSHFFSYNRTMRKTVIFDVDGTIQMLNIEDILFRGNKDWSL